jgi:hypothetical protein
VISRPEKAGDKAVPWPWRDWMTIGVGVLATSETGRAKQLLPDTAILVADTMGSFGDVDSHGRLHKTMAFPEEGVYATAADRIDRAAELLPMMCRFIADEAPRARRTYGDIMRALAKACFCYKVDRFAVSELPKIRLAPEVFDPRKCPPEIDAKVQPLWENFRIGCELIIAAFDCNGQALLFAMSGQDETIEPVGFPGYAAIGSGAGNAMFWLSRREHVMGMLPERAAYHAYEAKLMAEASPHVNEHLDLTVVTANDHWFISSHPLLGPASGKAHPTITLPMLKKWVKRYGVRSTEQLGRKAEQRPTLLTPRKTTHGE